MKPLWDGHPLKILDPDKYAPCSTCGMLTHPDFAVGHECPEPLAFEDARMMASAFGCPGAPPVSPRTYAQIKMALESGPT